MNQNLINRILTGIVAGAAAITMIVVSPYGIWLFCALISLLGLWEMMRTGGATVTSIKVVALVIGGIFWLIRLIPLIHPEVTELALAPYINVAMIVLPVLALLALFNKSLKDPIKEMSVIALAFLYVYLPFHLLYGMAIPAGAASYLWQIPLGILLLNWTLDSMAYFVGRFFGKHFLFPRISPKKTWEGSIGGAIFCMALGYGLTIWMKEVSWNWMVVAGIITVFGQLGDFVESMFKRSMNLKDSGNILPGHGGILDRFDGFIFSIPIIFLYFGFA